MNRRAGLVGLFLGATLMIGVWMVLPSAEQGGSTKTNTNKVNFKKGKISPNQLRAVPLATAPELSLRAIAARQDHLREITAKEEPTPGARPPGVFPLDQEGIATALETRKRDLKACYETALFHTPNLAATLTLVLTVEPAGDQFGQISKVDTEGSLDAVVFEGCVSTIVQELKFDATETTVVRYPLTFTEGPIKGDGKEL